MRARGYEGGVCPLQTSSRVMCAFFRRRRIRLWWTLYLFLPYRFERNGWSMHYGPPKRNTDTKKLRPPEDGRETEKWARPIGAPIPPSQYPPPPHSRRKGQ